MVRRDLSQRLRDAIIDGPAADRIRLVPPQPEIWPLLAAVDVAAITTLWPDPLPRVVMEAMAVGTPVAGYSGGGVPEMVVDGETGLLCRQEMSTGWRRPSGGSPGTRIFGAGWARRAESAPENSSASSATWIGWRQCSRRQRQAGFEYWVDCCCCVRGALASSSAASHARDALRLRVSGEEPGSGFGQSGIARVTVEAVEEPRCRLIPPTDLHQGQNGYL